MMETGGSSGHPALTDALTGLPNRLYWDTVFGVVFAAGSRGIPLTLILLEVDDYQEWSEKRSPDDSERLFQDLAETLGKTTRQSDLAARTQEARFSFLLLDCNLAGGRLVADRLEALLASIRERTGLNFSMGVAVYNREMATPESLYGAAEEALRTAQARGGGEIEFIG